ncbi:MAG TPA: sugar phosphate nucleotidyltransferase [Longimicrobiales bacterium]|nr:sugar phosphate nucleotidyltransferase [Longimicrobiales bacterium]
MLFAAGLGTRLAPLTNDMPKALIPLGGVPMLQRVAERVIAAGADRIIINVHHFAEQIERFVERCDGFGVEVKFSFEPGAPLETGGGLRHAGVHFRRNGPAILHNVDVWTTFPLEELLARHMESRPLATLAVNHRSASRYLHFDDYGLLGRVDTRTGDERLVREPVGEVFRLAFCGVHVIEPALLDSPAIQRPGAFSIIEAYLELAAVGARILPVVIDEWEWVDIGTPARLAAAERLLAG